MAKAFKRLERVYVSKEATYGQIVAPVAADVTRVIKCSMYNQTALLRRRDKTGTRSQTVGVKGRTVGRWTFESSLYGAGVTATPPDFNNLLQMLFGQAPTTGVYTLSDSIVSGDIWSFRRPSTIDQRVALGAVLQNFTFTLGQDIAEWQCDGISLGVLRSNGFSAADTDLKGGLVSFPAEPGTQTYTDAGAIAGFTGSILVDSIALAGIRNATIKGNTGNALLEDEFGHYYPTAAEGDERRFTFAFNVYDDDTSDLETIKEAADDKAPIDAEITIGTVAGNIFKFTVKGIQLDTSQMDESGRSYVNTYNDSPVSGSGPTALDELKLECL
jgi:hypothetical protein